MWCSSVKDESLLTTVTGFIQLLTVTLGHGIAHASKLGGVSALHVALEVALQLGPVVAEQTLKLRLLAALVPQMVDQRRSQLVRPAALAANLGALAADLRVRTSATSAGATRPTGAQELQQMVRLWLGDTEAK